jgi:Tol biopolymer transport system component
MEEEILYSGLDDFFSQPFLFATDKEGSAERFLPGQTASNSWVERFPDGTKLVYASSLGLGANWDIYIANADGSEESRLTFSSGADLYPY